MPENRLAATRWTWKTTGGDDAGFDGMKGKELTLYSGFLCCNTSVYGLQLCGTDETANFSCGECFGIYEKVEMCCLVHEFCLKAGKDPLGCEATQDGKTHYYCKLGLGCCALGCTKPQTCIETHQQTCCIVQSAAFPPSGAVPMTCAWCFIMCFPNPGCCRGLNDLDPSGEAEEQQSLVGTTEESAAAEESATAPPASKATKTAA